MPGPVRSKRKTIRRAREKKRQLYGNKKPWMCKEFGCDWVRSPYGSEKLPPGIILQKCKRCNDRRTARVQRW